MKKYHVDIDYTRNDNKWSCYENDDLVLKNVSYGEMVNFQRKALEELVDEGFLEKSKAFDILGDRIVFNEIFDSLFSEDY